MYLFAVNGDFEGLTSVLLAGRRVEARPTIEAASQPVTLVQYYVNIEPRERRPKPNTWSPTGPGSRRCRGRRATEDANEDGDELDARVPLVLGRLLTSEFRRCKVALVHLGERNERVGDGRRCEREEGREGRERARSRVQWWRWVDGVEHGFWTRSAVSRVPRESRASTHGGRRSSRGSPGGSEHFRAPSLLQATLDA